MCFHTKQDHAIKTIQTHYNVSLSDPSLAAHFEQPQYHLNGFSHPNMLIIPQQRPDLLAPGVWGLAPTSTLPDQLKAYYKDAVRYGGGLNAQSEKLFTHFNYKTAAFEHRCIIPVSGFFEPHEYQKQKYPFYIHPKNEQPLALAGIYNLIGTFITFSILTQPAQGLLKRVHNVKERQPIILNDALVTAWLSNELNEQAITDLITTTYDDTLLDAYPVSKALFNTRVDSNVASITQRVVYDGLPEL